MPRTAYEIVVEAGSDVLRNASKCEPIAALEELVWNALDADANNIQIDFERNLLEGLDWITVTDDGTGFEVSAKDAFGSFGTSLKKSRDKTLGGRLQHGREGRGRYKALSLGNVVTWESMSQHFDKHLITIIKMDTTTLNRLRPIEEVVDGVHSNGTKVTIAQPTDQAANFFDSDVASELALRFAPYLFAYPAVKITVNRKLVDPSGSLFESHTRTIDLEIDKKQYNAEIFLCVWRNVGADGRPLSRIYFCTRDGFTIEDHPGYVRRLGVSMTAYVKSAYFSTEASYGTYSGMGDLDVVAREFLSRTRELMRRLNREKLHELARQQVEDLKAENLYPFEGEAKSDIEKAERQVFDIVAEQLHVLAPDIANERPADRKRKMEALRVAITTEPTIQTFLVEQVLGLRPEQQKDFYEVLQRVPLSNVVGLAKEVLDRLHFLASLRHILFDPEVKQLLKERTQLQRILSDRLWLFGEQYHLGADDIALKNVLKRHRQILGLEETAFELQPEVAKSLNDVPDLMLYKMICDRLGYFDHLVIELKAPKVRCAEKELDQVKKYARTVAKCDDFDKTKTRWRFLLVSTAFQEDIYESEAQQRGRESGLILDHDNYQVWALQWSTIIQDAEGRHQFLKEKLDYQIREDAPGLDHLRANFASFLPDRLLEGESDQADTPNDSRNGGSSVSSHG